MVCRLLKEKKKRSTEAKVKVSLNYTVSDDFSNKLVKFGEEFMEYMDDEFEKFMRKQLKKFMEKKGID